MSAGVRQLVDVDVAVVGGGLGGLAAAVALRAVGSNVVVLERALLSGEAGAGITLFTNALQALDLLGIGGDVRALGRLASGGGVRTPTGRWLARSPAVAVQRAGVELLTVRRADLQALLLSKLPDGTVRTGVTVTAVDDPQHGPAMVASSGGVFSADVVVAADGLRSRVRQQHWPEAPAPRYAGFTAWRGVTAEAVEVNAGSETWGPGAEFGIVPLNGGQAYWFATANLPAGRTFPDERAEVTRCFGHWHPPIAQVVAATPATAVLRHDVYELPRPYPSFVRGRIALLGDAAHAMTPNAGQGGCQALEDAVVLAASLRAGDAPSGLRAYDRLRRRRTQRIAAVSASAGRFIQHREASRDALVRLTPPGLVLRALSQLFRWQPPNDER